MNRGGKRPGAGRPREAEPRVRLSVRVKPQTKHRLQELQINAGRLLDEYIEKSDEER